eukprot:4029-Heterococcus_DN1.PRE.4
MLRRPNTYTSIATVNNSKNQHEVCFAVYSPELITPVMHKPNALPRSSALLQLLLSHATLADCFSLLHYSLAPAAAAACCYYCRRGYYCCRCCTAAVDDRTANDTLVVKHAPIATIATAAASTITAAVLM